MKKNTVSKMFKPTSMAKLHKAMGLFSEGKMRECAILCDQLIKEEPQNCDAYHLMGVMLAQKKHHIPALDYFNKTISLFPSHSVALNNRGNLYQELKQPELAMEDFDRATKIKPDYAEAYYNKGIVLGTLHRIEEEIEHYDLALKYKPNFPEAYNNKGIALQKLHRMEETLANYDAGIKQNPARVEAFYNNRALVLQNLMRVEEALKDYDKAIDIDPNLADARFNRSLCLLLLGKYNTAWEEHEWRFNRRTYPRRVLPKEIYDGSQDLSGKTLFIHGEQGLGDMLQFCRYAKLAKEIGAKVILGVEKPLVRLLSTLDGVDTIIGAGDKIPDFDYHIPLMSLPYAFKTRMDNIPHGIYLNAKPEWIAQFTPKLSQYKKKRVGLVWSGGFRPDQPEVWAVNERRNIALSKLLPLKLDNVDYFSLQKGEEPEKELDNCLGWKDMINFTGDLNDFADTAGLIAHLDLVIAVDTSTAHLAAAMGKEVWMMNRFDTCWRWMINRTDSPWYPTIKIYNQPKLGDWESVVENIKKDLIEWSK